MSRDNIAFGGRNIKKKDTNARTGGIWRYTLRALLMRFATRRQTARYSEYVK
jgi:hypothetical protein